MVLCVPKCRTGINNRQTIRNVVAAVTGSSADQVSGQRNYSTILKQIGVINNISIMWLYCKSCQVVKTNLKCQRISLSCEKEAPKYSLSIIQ